MWMSDPTPETRTSIVLLRLSNVKPSGTFKAPLISIQLNSTAEIFGCLKIKQLQAKLPSTAATEIKLLNALDRRVNKVIAVAETNGRSKMYHGSGLLMSI
jgi:hypothetical protein